MLALSTRGLTKTYKNGVHALRSVDLDVEEGDFFALLGPNGAGKTTLIGIMTSLVNKTGGTASIFGFDIDKQLERAKSCIGVVPQELNFNQFESPMTIVVNQAGFYGIERAEARVRAERYLKQLQLWEKRNSAARGLSGGMKRRLMIARALMHEPRLLILDEPTAGVDIEIRRTMWDFLRDINARGTTIILTTHYLEEAESLCRNIAIIDKGGIIERDRMSNLLRRMNTQTFVLNTRGALQSAPPVVGFRGWASRCSACATRSTASKRFSCTWSRPAATRLPARQARPPKPQLPRREPSMDSPTQVPLQQSIARARWIGFKTIVIREYSRIVRIWGQTLVPSAVTATLYFVIFGSLIGRRVGPMAGFDYRQFIAPGLIMMSIITNSYGNVVSSFFGAKFGKHIEELMVSPLPTSIIVAGYTAGGLIRGLMVGGVVTLVSLFFARLPVAHFFAIIAAAVLTSAVFSLAGFINAVFARNFDQMNFIPVFVLTPLTYFGGVFYSVSMLPDWAQKLSFANPILHMVNAFRYGFLGTSDVHVVAAFGLMVLLTVALFAIAVQLLGRGVGVRD